MVVEAPHRLYICLQSAAQDELHVADSAQGATGLENQLPELRRSGWNLILLYHPVAAVSVESIHSSAPPRARPAPCQPLHI